MKIIRIILLTFIFLLFRNILSTEEYTDKSTFTKDKFLVKTNVELKISESTGKICLQSGNKSLDSLINVCNVREIKTVFNRNHSDLNLYEKYDLSKYYILYLDTLKNPEILSIINLFAQNEFIEFSEPNFIGYSAGVKEKGFNSILYPEPNDEGFKYQWYLKNQGNVQPASNNNAKIGADINILKAWEIEEGNDSIIVAILDSGIKDLHPDIKNRIWINKKEIPGNGIDDDMNGYVDDYKGWDFAYNTNTPADGFGHGTNIASVIGAETNNLIGFAGINKKCRLMNCKNLNDDNYGEYEWWAESMQYAVDNGAKIINMSEGGSDYSKTLKVACSYAYDKGALIVAAMMNKANNVDHYPASYDFVLAVGATDSDDKLCKKFSWGGGSCWGKHISVVAPGNKIYGLDFENDNNNEVYWSGTSQSTAIVSGIASLLLSNNSSLTNRELREIICFTAIDKIGDPSQDKNGWDEFYGFGRVDAYRALTNDRSQNVNNVTGKENKKENKDNREENKDNQQAEPAKADKSNSRKPH
jgi:thermitase